MYIYIDLNRYMYMRRPLALSIACRFKLTGRGKYLKVQYEWAQVLHKRAQVQIY